MEDFKAIINSTLTEDLDLDYRILVVEDDDMSFSLIKEILGTCNIKPLRAFDGQEAVDLFKEDNNAFDLVFMDIRLPKLNGFEATREIKQINNSIPVVAVTSYVHSQYIVDCYDAGCDEFITKPYDISKILSFVDMYVVNK